MHIIKLWLCFFLIKKNYINTSSTKETRLGFDRNHVGILRNEIPFGNMECQTYIQVLWRQFVGIFPKFLKDFVGPNFLFIELGIYTCWELLFTKIDHSHIILFEANSPSLIDTFFILCFLLFNLQLNVIMQYLISVDIVWWFC